jgi:stalled ribosome alternative rescue factor ArfA
MSDAEENRHRARSENLIEALKEGDAEGVLNCLRRLDRIDGPTLVIIIKLLEGDPALKPLFRNRFKIVTWSRGRPKKEFSDPIMRPLIRKQIQRWRDGKGSNLKKAIHKAQNEFGLSRSSLMVIWGEKPKPKSG